MNAIRSLFSEEVIEAIGWVLFHSSWQATLLLIVLIVALILLRNFSSQVRYMAAYATLLLILGTSIVTGIKTYHYAVEKQALKERVITSPDGMTEEIKALLAPAVDSTLEKPSKSHLKWMNLKVIIQSNFPLVFTLWLIGILFFLLRMAGGMVYLQRLSKRQLVPFEPAWQQKADALINSLAVSKPVQVCQSYLAKVPMVIGHLKPVVLIPVSIFTGLSDKEIEAIIAHELAHIKRNDYLFNILQAIIETLFFFHPAVWIVSRIIRDEREHSCDDMAITATGDKLNYIKALASAEELKLKTHYQAVAFTQRKGGLLHRVKRIKTLNTMKRKVNEGFFAASLIFISLILLSFTGIYNQSNDEMAPHYADIINNSDIGLLSQEELAVRQDTLKKKVKQQLEKLEEVPEGIDKIIEVALAEEDPKMAAEILKSVEEALSEVNWQEIKADALREVEHELGALNMDSIMDAAMIEASTDIEAEMKALKEEGLQSDEEIEALRKKTLEDAKNGIEIARSVMKNMRMDTIIEFSLNEAMNALSELDDIDDTIRQALDSAKIEMTVIEEEEIK